MTWLTLEVHFLARRYHGAEWPPSPMRLLQAIVAGSHSTDHPALRWMESQKPPLILAEPDPARKELITYVPANNVREKEARTPKRVYERRVSRPVSYMYELTDISDVAIANQIIDLAAKVHTLGTGLDAAHVVACIEGNMPAVAEGRLRWMPWQRRMQGHLRPSICSRLRTPIPGSLASVEEVYQFKLRRNLFTNGGEPRVPNPPPTRHALAIYAPAEAARCHLFLGVSLYTNGALKQRWAAYPEDTVVVAGMLRHALLTRAQEADAPKYVMDMIAGHPRDRAGPRISYLPLPSIGHRRADGLIRRALLLVPAEQAQEEDEWIGLVEEPLPLIAEGRSEAVAYAAFADELDNVFRLFLGRATTWTSATPVVLPGDYTRGWTLVEKLVRKALKEAGFAPEEIVNLSASKSPMIAGVKHAHAYRRKQTEGRSYTYHVRVQFSRQCHGPIWIGRQKHQGLGVMASANPERE